MRRGLIPSIFKFFVLTLSPSALGQLEEAIQPEAASGYQPPRAVNMSEVSYPWLSAQNGQEGWVLINYMVDVNGEPFDPVVTASVGSDRFKQAAVTAIMESDFEPALFDGEPVEGAKFQRFTFILEDTNGATSQLFINRYRNFSRRMANEEIDEARELLSWMNSRDIVNLYEAAFISLANYLMAKFDGDVYGQLHHLQAALSYEGQDGGKSFLPEESVLFARFELFKLLVENKFYAETFRAFNAIANSGSSELANALLPTMDQISSILNDDSSYPVYGKIPDSTVWFINLYKPYFYFGDVVGEIDELSLACDRKYSILAYEEDARYTIPRSWGKCALRLLGRPGTEFILVQGPRDE